MRPPDAPDPAVPYAPVPYAPVPSGSSAQRIAKVAGPRPRAGAMPASPVTAPYPILHCPGVESGLLSSAKALFLPTCEPKCFPGWVVALF